MKKYEVTEKHPFYKESLIIEDFEMESEYCQIHARNNKSCEVNKINIPFLIKQGWIKEIEEYEFTKSDMKEFAMFNYKCFDNRQRMKSVNENLDEWIKENKK